MIARATLAWMLAGPVLVSGMGSGDGKAAAATLKQREPSEVSQGIRERATRATWRRPGKLSLAADRRPARRDPAPAIVASLDDDLAYDTPRDSAGRPIIARHNPGQQIGTASWYGGPEWQGRLMTNGERYDQDQMTAAHPSLPLESLVRVSLLDDSRSVVVRITDRPGTRRRVVDLSRAAAARLGMLYKGIAQVRLDPL